MSVEQQIQGINPSNAFCMSSGKGIIEIIPDPDLTRIQTKRTRRGALRQGHQTREGAAGFGDDDFLAGCRALDQP